MKDNDSLIQEQIDQLNENARIVVEGVVEAIKAMTPVIVDLIDTFSSCWNELILISGNGRVKHLAMYAKKQRTRKKNFHRLQKQFMRLVTDKVTSKVTGENGEV